MAEVRHFGICRSSIIKDSESSAEQAQKHEEEEEEEKDEELEFWVGKLSRAPDQSGIPLPV